MEFVVTYVAALTRNERRKDRRKTGKIFLPLYKLSLFQRISRVLVVVWVAFTKFRKFN